MSILFRLGDMSLKTTQDPVMTAKIERTAMFRVLTDCGLPPVTDPTMAMIVCSPSLDSFVWM